MAPPSGDTALSIRFRHGTLTVFLFVDPTAPFSRATSELLDVLHERYADNPAIITVPTAPRVSYAVMANPHDPAEGWKNLNVKGSETPAAKGLKNNAVVAFALQDEDDEDAPEFLVEWPKLDDDEEGEPVDDELDG